MQRAFRVIPGLSLFATVQGRELGFEKIVFVKRHTYSANQFIDNARDKGASKSVLTEQHSC